MTPSWGEFADTPFLVDFGNDWVTVASLYQGNRFGGGDDYPIALKSDGSLWLWDTSRGNPDFGALFNPSPMPFTRIGTDTDWAAVTAYNDAFLGLKIDGTIYSGRLIRDRPVLSIDSTSADIDWGPPESSSLSNEFRIARHALGFDTRFRAVVGPLSNDCYTILYRGDGVTNINQPVDIRFLPSARAFQLTDRTHATTNGPAFYRVRQVPVGQPLDSDGDGIDDVYELRHSIFLSPLDDSDADQDYDGDGRSNLQEYREGTDPEVP